MNTNHIILFSSDAKPLYKGDIFRVLALPDDYTIQFRYPVEYVEKNILRNPSGLVNRDAVIFFLAGNDLSKKAEERKLVPFPIRGCKIKEAFIDSVTSQLFLILELGKFLDCAIKKCTEAQMLPPQTFVSDTQLEGVNNVQWIDRVKTIEKHFEGILFYRINAIFLEDMIVKPSYSPTRRVSYYDLNEESEYSIECNGYDRGAGDLPLHIKGEYQEISLSNSFETGVGAQLDTKRFPLTTRTVSSQSAPAEAVFFSRQSKEEASKDLNRVILYWRVIRKPEKVEQFAAFTFLAAIGLGLSEEAWKDAQGNIISPCDVAIKMIGVVIIAYAASQLYRFFNKIS